MPKHPAQLGRNGSRTDRSGSGFETTHWTLIDEIRSDQQPRRCAAMQRLLAGYWPPVYAFLRGKGMGRDRAEEMTQAFFVDIVLSRALFESAERGRGKLRTLMLRALQNYVVDEWRRAGRGQAPCTDGWSTVQRMWTEGRGPDQEEAMLPPAAGTDGGAAEGAFERRWALAQVEEALKRCREHFEQTGRTGHWRAFELRHLLPAVSMTAPAPLCEVAAGTGFTSAADACAGVQSVRKRLMVCLFEVVGETVEDGAEVEHEVRRLVELLGM